MLGFKLRPGESKVDVAEFVAWMPRTLETLHLVLRDGCLHITAPVFRAIWCTAAGFMPRLQPHAGPVGQHASGTFHIGLY